MTFVIVNDEGKLYYGYDSSESKPIWKKTRPEGCALTSEMADAAIKQLKALGYEKIAKRPANEIIRKWVPADCDATKV